MIEFYRMVTIKVLRWLRNPELEIRYNYFGIYLPFAYISFEILKIPAYH